jgi:DNA-binding XRE family transcriptional regulator
MVAEERRVACRYCGADVQWEWLEPCRETAPGTIALYRGVTEFRCANGHRLNRYVREPYQLAQLIPLMLLVQQRFLHGEEVRFLRLTFGLTQKRLANTVNLRRATIADWEREPTPRRDVATEYYVRAVLLGLLQAYMETWKFVHLRPSQLDLLRRFEAGFHQARGPLAGEDARIVREIPLHLTRKWIWMPGTEPAGRPGALP